MCQTAFGSVSFPHSSLISRIYWVHCDYSSVIHFIQGKELSSHPCCVQFKLVHPSTTIPPFHSRYLILSLLCPSMLFPGQSSPGLCVCLKSGGRVWSEPFSRGLCAYLKLIWVGHLTPAHGLSFRRRSLSQVPHLHL